MSWFSGFHAASVTTLLGQAATIERGFHRVYIRYIPLISTPGAQQGIARKRAPLTLIVGRLNRPLQQDQRTVLSACQVAVLVQRLQYRGAHGGSVIQHCKQIRLLPYNPIGRYAFCQRVVHQSSGQYYQVTPYITIQPFTRYIQAFQSPVKSAAQPGGQVGAAKAAPLPY